MSRKGEIKTVGEAVQDLLNVYRIKDKFDEKAVTASWERIVGKPIAKRTKRLWLRNSVLFIEFDSPTIKSDFSFHKTKVIEVFQKEFGKDSVKEIVIM
jgi:predicted nucleic acid-binding Zn ribbon protein